jgi:N-acetylglutamate synthase-like GNAT family acetyltransferase
VSGVGINLVSRDSEGRVVIGVGASTMLREMYLAVLWVDERCRGLRLSIELLMAAERIAKENGCIAAQTYALSFQAPEFFQRVGFEVFGISNGYPEPCS